MNELKLAREMIHTMNAKQKDVASDIGVSRANLSRMLSGIVPIGKHFHKINDLFETWKESKLKELNKEINQLNLISKKATKCLKS
jgi:predicted transcriptional regulator